MKKVYTVSFILILVLIAPSCKKDTSLIAGNTPTMSRKASALTRAVTFPANIPAHPRLLLAGGQEQSLIANIAASQSLTKVSNEIISEANNIMTLPEQQRGEAGSSLLNASREEIRRIFDLAYAFRITNQIAYFNRAEQEMINVCGFADWNAQNSFLDCAEMITAVAIGYDWLYNNLSASDISTIQSGIINLGLQPSFVSSNGAFLTMTNNWNQVCNAGLTLGALAIYESNTPLAQATISRAVQTISTSMYSEYNPNGTYLEGFSYWNYGTTYNVLMIDALQKVFGTDFGLSTTTGGFLQTATYFENMTGPTNVIFNYSDAFSGDLSQFPDVAMYWFAQKTNNPSLLYVENNYLANSPASSFGGNRFLPALLIWSQGLSNTQVNSPPSSKVFRGYGMNPVAMLRTSWTDPNAIYVGVKAGEANNSHGHMDVGSFVMDANGQRWAALIGGANYTPILAAGYNLWDYSQGSARWTAVPQYNNTTNNTLTINNHLQNVYTFASILSTSANSSCMNVIQNAGGVYPADLSKWSRGIAIMNQSYVVVRDELSVLNPGASVNWSMLTPANVQIISNNMAVLTQNGQTLTMVVQQPSNVNLTTWTNTYNYMFTSSGLQTVTMVGFTTQLNDTNVDPIVVLLLPGNTNYTNPGANISVPALASWPTN